MSDNSSINSNQRPSSAANKKHKYKLKSTLLVQEMLRDEVSSNEKTSSKEEKKTPVNKSDIKLPIKRDYTKKEPVNKSDIKLPIKRDYTKKEPVNKSSSKKEPINKSDNKKEPVNKANLKKATMKKENNKKESATTYNKEPTKEQENTSIKSSLLRQKLEEQKMLLDKNRTFDSINKLVRDNTSYTLTTDNNIDVNKINNMFD
ncbi:hypothetical protein FOG48_03085 [Hanseniaspora uvarum]|nr:hypothetical protein FOG48_03085 [Hanseniaspora uvarum]